MGTHQWPISQQYTLNHNLTMPVKPSDLQVGAIYATPVKKGSARQYRKIDEIKNGRVLYSSCGEIALREWRRPHTLSNPPLIDTFCKAVESLHLSAPSNS